MILPTLLILTLVAVSLGVISAIADDRWILVPAGGVFLMCSMMILPAGLQVKTGMESYSDSSAITTPKTDLENISYREYDIYTNIDNRYDINMSRYIAAIYAGLGLFFIMRGTIGRGNRFLDR